MSRRTYYSPLLTATLLCCTVAGAQAQVTPYDSLSAFQTASNTAVVVTFNAFTPKDTNVFIPPDPPYTEGGIAFLPIDSLPATPNLYVAAPGGACSGCFGVPLTQNVLTSSGNEHIDMTFASPPTAVGWDTYTNSFAPPVVTVYDASDNLLGTFTLTQAPRTLGFFGITSTIPIGRIDWLATLGGVEDTGLAQFRVGSLATVPEPGLLALLTGTAGFGAILLLRRRRR